MKINFGIIKTKYQKASVCVTIRSLTKKASLKSAKIILIFHHKPYLQVNLTKKKKVNWWVQFGNSLFFSASKRQTKQTKRKGLLPKYPLVAKSYGVFRKLRKVLRQPRVSLQLLGVKPRSETLVHEKLHPHSTHLIHVHSLI